MATKKGRSRKQSDNEEALAQADKERMEQESSGSAVEREAYGEENFDEPTGVNTTSAPGVDSHTQPGAAEGIDQTRATPHLAPAVTDPNYAMNAAKRAMKAKYGEDVPYILHGNLHVRRGDQIVEIPHGRVVSDLELTEDEFDQAIDAGIIREATVAEFRAQQEKDAQEEAAKKLREHKKEMIGQKPKSSSGDKPPKGAKVISDLNAPMTERERVQAALGARKSA